MLKDDGDFFGVFLGKAFINFYTGITGQKGEGQQVFGGWNEVSCGILGVNFERP